MEDMQPPPRCHNAMLSACASSGETAHADPPSLRPAVRAACSLALIVPAAAQAPAARGADRSAAVLPRRQDEGRAAEAETEPVHRAVSQDRFFHRPSRCGAAIPRAHQESYSGGGADGRRRDRMRRDVYKRPATGLPAFAMRPAHHDQYPVDAGACRKMHHAVHSGRSRHRPQGIGKVLHQRHHAGRIQDAVGQDGRLQSERHHRGRLSERHAALAHRPLQPFRHADDP